MSSNGKAISDTEPHAQITSAPSGDHQPLGRRTEVSDGRRSPVNAIAITPGVCSPHQPRPEPRQSSSAVRQAPRQRQHDPANRISPEASSRHQLALNRGPTQQASPQSNEQLRAHSPSTRLALALAAGPRELLLGRAPTPSRSDRSEALSSP